MADHSSATSHAGGEADQSHEVRHAADRRHRLLTQRLQADLVTPCTQSVRAGGLAVHGRQANEIALPTVQAWFALRKLRPTQNRVLMSHLAVPRKVAPP